MQVNRAIRGEVIDRAIPFPRDESATKRQQISQNANRIPIRDRAQLTVERDQQQQRDAGSASASMRIRHLNVGQRVQWALSLVVAICGVRNSN